MHLSSKVRIGLAVAMVFIASCGKQGNETLSLSGKRVVKLREDVRGLTCQGVKEIARILSL